MDERSIPELLKTGMIWARESVPVVVREGGHASSIAGHSVNGAAEDVTDLHAVFIKELALSRIPARGELHLFAYTRYRLYVNGQYAGRGPSRFQNQRPEYDTRDIAQFLRAGRNRIAVLVHRDAPTGRIMYHDPGFAAVFEWGEAGSKQNRIASDATWRAKPEMSFGPRDTAWSAMSRAGTGGAASTGRIRTTMPAAGLFPFQCSGPASFHFGCEQRPCRLRRKESGIPAASRSLSR